jgi:hypothetical protein
VVNIVNQSWFDNNFASPGTTFQFGPYVTAASVIRLLRVRSTIAVTYPSSILAFPTSLRDQVAWGVQSGAHGYTPLVLPANLGAGDFYWSQLLGGNTANGTSWEPTTSTDIGWMSMRVNDEEWRSQRPVGAVQDFYVTGGAIAAGSFTFAASHTLEVTYSY